VGTNSRLPHLHGSFLHLASDGFFKSIPKELEDAAMVDGLTRFGRSSSW